MPTVPRGYTIRKSTRKGKKYDVYRNDKYLLSFGSADHDQWKDETPLQLYKHKDHLNSERRRLYFLRHKRTSDINSPKYWSNTFLWGG